MNFNDIKDLAPFAKENIYLETPARGLIINETLSASKKALDGWQNFEDESNNKVVEARVISKISKLLRSKQENIVLTSCTAHSFNIIANSYPFSPTDNIVIADCEHPNNFYPWAQLLAKGVDVRVTKNPDGFINVDRLIESTDINTKIIAVSLITFYPGAYLEIEKLAEFTKDNDIFLIVDAVQAIGFVPVYPSEMGIDALSTAAYKGLMSPHGNGFMYLSDKLANKLATTEFRNSNVIYSKMYQNLNFDLIDSISRLQPYPNHIAGMASVEAAVDIINALTPEKIAEYLLDLSRKLTIGLNDLGYETKLADTSPLLRQIVCFETPVAQDLADFAKEKGLYVSARRDGIRFGFHIYNDANDVDRALYILKSYKESSNN